MVFCRRHEFAFEANLELQLKHPFVPPIWSSIEILNLGNRKTDDVIFVPNSVAELAGATALLILLRVACRHEREYHAPSFLKRGGGFN